MYFGCFVGQCRVHLEVRVSHTHKEGVVKEMAHWQCHRGRGQRPRGVSTKSENTDQATKVVKVQSRNSTLQPFLCLYLSSDEIVHACCFLFMLEFSATIPSCSIDHFYLNMPKAALDDRLSFYNV